MWCGFARFGLDFGRAVGHDFGRAVGHLCGVVMLYHLQLSVLSCLAGWLAERKKERKEAFGSFSFVPRLIGSFPFIRRLIHDIHAWGTDIRWDG